MGNSDQGTSFMRVGGDERELRPWHYIYVHSVQTSTGVDDRDGARKRQTGWVCECERESVREREAARDRKRERGGERERERERDLQWRGRREWCRSVHPTPTPYILHPTSYTLHRTLYTLQATPFTVHRAPYTGHPRGSYTLTSSGVDDGDGAVALRVHLREPAWLVPRWHHQDVLRVSMRECVCVCVCVCV